MFRFRIGIELRSFIFEIFDGNRNKFFSSCQILIGVKQIKALFDKILKEVTSKKISSFKILMEYSARSFFIKISNGKSGQEIVFVTILMEHRIKHCIY